MAGQLDAAIPASATVEATPDAEAVLTARAPGRVTRVLKRLGDPVRQGEALAIVESREAAQMAADRSVANAKATLAQRNLAREKSLYDQRVSPRMDYEQAQAEAAAAAAEVRRAQASASVAGITSDGRGVVVSSPIAGRVTAVTASLGAFVQPESELFRVADPRLVQVEATIGASEASRVAPGDRAELTTADGRRIEGRVRSITPALNPETRSATAIIDMATAGLQPGQAAQVRIFPRSAGAGSAIVVPEEAVQTVEGREVVFVRTPKGFEAKPVRTGQRSAGRIEVLAGLQPGQVIATRNAFLLKAELGTGEEE
jgi:cobalt-zinc-cadmium efflux system membrane fusion protein